MGIKMSAEISVMASLTRLEKPVNHETLQFCGHTGIQQRNANLHYTVSMQTEVKVDCNAYTMSLIRLQGLGEGM